MTTATSSPKSKATPGDPMQPVNWGSYEDEKEARAAEKLTKQPTLMKCLDPIEAARLEAKKSEHEYEISCDVVRIEKKKRRIETLRGRARGQNEGEAWAAFCDDQETWPSPATCNRKITKLKDAA